MLTSEPLLLGFILCLLLASIWVLRDLIWNSRIALEASLRDAAVFLIGRGRPGQKGTRLITSL